MNVQETPTETRKTAPFRRRILGSFVAPLTAWAAFNVFCVIMAFATSHSSDWWVGPAFVAIYSTAFIFGTWLLVLLPLYLLIPQHSVLWHWPLCTGCGALAGAAIIVSWSAIFYPQATDRVYLGVLAAVIGGVTCLTASLTRRRFQYDRNA